MKKTLTQLCFSLAIAGAVAAPAHAGVETFDSSASAAANGFALSSNIQFVDSGRPYLEYYDQGHTITATTPFTFNSIDFNYVPWNGYVGGNNTVLKMVLRDASNAVLLDASIGITPAQGWFTYTNTIANVSRIDFAPTGGFWPSFDNLRYNEAAADVPEPASIALFGLGILGYAASRRRRAKR